VPGALIIDNKQIMQKLLNITSSEQLQNAKRNYEQWPKSEEARTPHCVPPGPEI
jgi:hypothetical protein